MNTVHILPNLRKGLSNNITNGLKDKKGIRPVFEVSASLKGRKVKSTDDGKPSTFDELSKERSFAIAGPVDVRSVNEAAICQVVPANKATGFSRDYMPYIEFYDEDFPWRYTPQANEEKLKPWLLLLACKESEFRIVKDSRGFMKVEVTPEEGSEDTFYPDWSSFYKLAHVQITAPEEIYGSPRLLEYIKENPDDGVSRLFCSRPLDKYTEYTMFLVPAFELGRLSGLREPVNESVGIETPSWSADSAHNTRAFPVYYKWSFKTANEKFLDLAEKQRFLPEKEFAALPDTLKADIGETGLRNYKIEFPGTDDQTPIDIPVALVKNGFDENKLIEEMDYQIRAKSVSGVPQKGLLSKGTAKGSLSKVVSSGSVSTKSSDNRIGEGMAEELYGLLKKSPVFNENSGTPLSAQEDPWIVPPVYGARHVLAEESALKDDKTFLKNLNLKFRNRAAAGMGVSVVKRNQEVFTNRAWGMIEEINALNQRIREFYEAYKLNGAADKKTSSLRYYEFKPTASGLQADAAIRVANAQSSADINAVDLALDVAGDQSLLSVLSSVMPDYKKAAGMTEDELNAIANPENWTSNWYTIVQLNKLFSTLIGKIDYFSLVSYDFLKNIFEPVRTSVVIDFENKKVKLEDGADCLYRLKNNQIYKLLPIIGDYAAVKDSNAIFRWLNNDKVFKYGDPKGHSYTTIYSDELLSFRRLLDGAHQEFEEKWGDNLGSEAGFMHQMCVPVRLCVGLDGDPVETISEEWSCGNGVFMKQKTYMKYFPEYPQGVAFNYVEDGINNSLVEKKFYILPESKLTEDGSGITLYKKYTCEREEWGYPDTFSAIKIEKVIGVDRMYLPADGVFDEKMDPYWDLNGVSVKKATMLVQCNRYHLLDEVLGCWPEKYKNYEEGKQELHYGTIFSNSDSSVKWGFTFIPGWQNNYFWMESKKYGKASFYIPVDASVLIGYHDPVRKTLVTQISYSRLYHELKSVFEHLVWFNTVAWTPNFAVMEAQPVGIKEFTADELAGLEVVKTIESINKSYDDIIKQVNDLAEGLKKAGIISDGASKSADASPEAEASALDPEQILAVDADEINRGILIDRAKDFGNRGMKLDLMKSNFDGKYPIMAYPIFPDPTSFYLRELSDRFLLPSVDKLKMNSISCFITNPIFEEAFLAGMNTEMGRELLWREYPTDERGSYFRKFWDQVNLDDFSNGYFDVKNLHSWDKPLGKNHEDGKGQLMVFVVKSELMLVYPQTTICLARRAGSSGSEYLDPFLYPEMTGWISNDTFMAGFDVSKVNNKSGVYLAFVETDKSQRFDHDAKSGKTDGSLSSDFATNRADFGSVWGIEVKPENLTIQNNS